MEQLDSLSLEEQLDSLSLEEQLDSLSLEEHLDSLSLEEHLDFQSQGVQLVALSYLNYHKLGFLCQVCQWDD